MSFRGIQPNLIVADVLSRWPETVDVFIQRRMACIGCSMASFMTLEDAIRIYGLDSKTFLDALEEAIQNKEAQDDPHKMTKKMSDNGENFRKESGRE